MKDSKTLCSCIDCRKLGRDNAIQINGHLLVFGSCEGMMVDPGALRYCPQFVSKRKEKKEEKAE